MAEQHGDTSTRLGDFDVRRRVRIFSVEPALLSRLKDLPGMIDVVAKGKRLQLHYDRSRIGFSDIERAGLNPAGGWFTRARHAIWRYLDENARDNAGHSAGNCCSNPVDVYSRRTRR